MLRPADVTWSNVPVIDTFGAGGPAGAWARTGGASIASATKARTAGTRLLLITASSSGGEKHRILRQHSTPTSPTTPERSRIQSDPEHGRRACALPAAGHVPRVLLVGRRREGARRLSKPVETTARVYRGPPEGLMNSG